MHMMFERCQTENRKRSLKQHIEYSHFRCNIQSDLPVQGDRGLLGWDSLRCLDDGENEDEGEIGPRVRQRQRRRRRILKLDIAEMYA